MGPRSYAVLCALHALSCAQPQRRAAVIERMAKPAVVVPAVPAAIEPVAPPAADDASAPPRGSLSKEAIRRTIRKNIDAIRLCWEDALQRDPRVGVRLTAHFQIAGDGRVTNVKTVDTTVKDAELERCVHAAVRAMQFTPPEGGGYVEVTYPFIVETTGG